MAVSPTAIPGQVVSETRTRARVLGILFLLFAVAILVLFGVGSEPGLKTTFQLNQTGGGTTAVRLPDLVVPSRGTALLLSAICAFLAGVQLTRGFGRRTNVILGIVVFVFVFAFLTWAAQIGRAHV